MKAPFSFTRRVGKKWQTVAYVHASCLARTGEAARACGFDTTGLTAQFTACLEAQKNWLGCIPEAPTLAPSELEVDRQWFIETAAYPCYANAERFYATFPDARQFSDDLAHIWQDTAPAD